MNNLKMKFKLHWLEYEVEGHEDTVKSQFADFKSFLWDLLPKVNVIDIPSLNNSSDERWFPTTTKTLQSNTEYPHLKELAMLDLPTSEPDWILVYAFYSSSFGTKTFTLEDIKNKYQETGRKTENNSKNLSQNLASLVKKWYIKMYNDSEYLLKQNGIEHVNEILKGNVKAKTGITKKTKTSTITKTTSSKTKQSSSPKQLSDLNLRPDGKISLRDFFGQYDIKSNFDRNIIYVYYLEKVLEIPTITIDHIFTCYRETNQKIPNIYQSLIDTKGRKWWIDTTNIDSIKTTITGTNYIEFDAIKK